MTAAFVGGICLCVPSFVDSVDKEGEVTVGILPHMTDDFGAGSFDAGNEATRFQALLQSESELGKDLRDLFVKMKQEVHARARYQDLDDTSVFKTQVHGTGLVQGKLMEKPQREFTRRRTTRSGAAALGTRYQKARVCPSARRSGISELQQNVVTVCWYILHGKNDSGQRSIPGGVGCLHGDRKPHLPSMGRYAPHRGAEKEEDDSD